MSDSNGNGHHDALVLRQCPGCHRPVDDEGTTTFRGTHSSKGFEAPTCKQCGYGWRGIYLHNQKPLEERVEVAKRASAVRVERHKKRTLSQMMEERMLVVIDKVFDPYMKALELAPNEEWSPRTKLQFYSEQTSITEKMFNRAEGLPVARQRNVDRNDNDVAKMQNLPPAVLERVLSSALAEIELSDEDIIELSSADVTEEGD